MLNWVPLDDGSEGVMIRKEQVLSLVPNSSKYSRYAVRWTDFLLISAIDVSLKTDKEPQREARSITEGLETWYPLAPGLGLNSTVD